MYRIVRRKEMAGGEIILNEIEAPKIARIAKPGQFVILRANEMGERVPMTMADINAEKGTITIIFHVVGRSTALFKTLQVGDYYLNVAGPLGRPTEVGFAGTAICVGGGTGLAVLYPIAKKLKSLGNRVVSIIGARTKELVILQEEMAAVSDELLICTDDGSLGRKTLVTELLDGGPAKRDARTGGGHRASAHDETGKRYHPATPDQDHRQLKPHHDRRHRHVWQLQSGGGRRDEAGLRGRAGV